MITSILRFTNIILAALLAGVSLGIWIGFNPMQLSASAYLEQQQHMDQSLKVLMVSLVIAATAITLISAFVQRQNKPTFIGLLAAAACFIACMIITKFGNVPIDREIMTWTANTMPENWKEFRDEWWSFHIWRAIVELVALVLVVWTGIRKD
jgi:hypothetical protein